MPNDLPVSAVLSELFDALRKHGAAVLGAAPGAGKTTLVPPRALEEVPGKILLAEPRRIAAKAAARRIAGILGETVGDRAGFAVRGETRIGLRTRIIAETGGVLLRQLQEDPELPGVSLIIFDEFHERSLDSDLALALALDIRANLRPDLWILVMSATLDSARIAALLGDAPVAEAPGRLFPVEVRRRDEPLRRNDPGTAAARAVLSLYREETGDFLVFLPGAGEIAKAQTLLTGALPPEALLLPLHGSLSSEEQDAPLRPPPPGRRKVVLATNIAESSITIDGIRIVIDTGLEKRPVYSPAAGISFLESCRISQASAAQRAGRAGRTQPGVALQLWSDFEHASLEPFTPPEIRDADLAPLALQLAAWGAEPETLRWLDPPSPARFAAAREELRELGALDASNRLTARGRELARLPLHPRIGTLLLAAREAGSLPLGAALAALLEERDAFGRCDSADLGLRVAALRNRPREFPREETVRQQLLHLFPRSKEQDNVSLGLLVAAAWPEWIARRRTKESNAYLLAGGTGAELPPGDPLSRSEFLAVARLDGVGGRSARIRLAAPLDEAELLEAFGDRVETAVSLRFDPEREQVYAREEKRLGKLVLASTPVSPPPGMLARAVLEAAFERKQELPPADQKPARRLLERIRFAAREEPGDWPDWSPETWRQRLPELGGNYFPELKNFAGLRNADFLLLLRSELGAVLQERLDRDFPDRFTTPAGASHAIDYSGDQPALAAKVQELYGVRTHPTVGRARMPLKLELLSPAGRPIQVTSDLPLFWRGNWPLVQKEMRSRYPKHLWPDDPMAAQPTLRAKKTEKSG